VDDTQPRKAPWPFRLPADTSPERVGEIRGRVEDLSSAAQYGWGHTIDFGPFAQEGLLGDNFLEVAGLLDRWGWWPRDLTGKQVADVGCFTGGLSLYLSARGPEVVHAVDEVPEHLAQAAYLAEVFGQGNVRTLQSSIYDLTDHLPENSLDLILCSGVLYHLSDMLVGLYILRRLLKPGGTLLLETNAVRDNRRSYANFGRFYKGMWWQPSGLCVRDMCDFTGFGGTEVRFYSETRCLARTLRSAEDEIPFKRGFNWHFESLQDARLRSVDEGIMAPALPVEHWLRLAAALPRRLAREVRARTGRGA